jgi:hypothetical protein
VYEYKQLNINYTEMMEMDMHVAYLTIHEALLMYVLNEVPIKLFQHEIKMMDYCEYNEVKPKHSKQKNIEDFISNEINLHWLMI